MTDPYRAGSTKAPPINPPKLAPNELAFWERMVIAMETSSILVKDGQSVDVAARADMFVLLRRERLPIRDMT